MERFAIKIDERVKLNLYNICRLCGIDNRDQVPIIDEPDSIFILDDEPSLCKKIVDCVGIQVEITDRMPQKMCTLCVDKINDFYEYREMCKATNLQTRELLGLPPEIKDEKPSIQLVSKPKRQQTFVEIPVENVKRKRKLKSECINYEEIDDDEIDEKPPKKKFTKNSVSTKSKKHLSPNRILIKRESVKPLPSRVLPTREKAIPVSREKSATLIKEKLIILPIKEKTSTLRDKPATSKEKNLLVKEKLPTMKEKTVLQPVKEKGSSTKEKFSIKEKLPPSMKDKSLLVKEKSQIAKEKSQLEREKLKPVKEKSMFIAAKLPMLKEKLNKEKTTMKEKLIPVLQETVEPASSKMDSELITLKTPNRRERQRELETKKKRKVQTIQPLDKLKTENLYACIVCPKDFKTQPEYDIHFFREHTPNTLEHGCSACREAFYDLQEYRDHQLWHRLSSIPFSCFKCNSHFDRVTAYTRHFLTSCVPHIEYILVDDIKCQKCQKTFVTKNLYEWHGCLIKNNSKCPRCGKFFAKRLNLQRHIVLCDDKVVETRPVVCVARNQRSEAVEGESFNMVTSNDGMKIVKIEPGSILELENESRAAVINSNDGDDHEMEDSVENDVGIHENDREEIEEETRIEANPEIDDSANLDKDNSDIISIPDVNESTAIMPIKQEKVDRRYDEVICTASANIPMVQIKQEIFNTDYVDQVDFNVLRNIKPEPIESVPESVQSAVEPNTSKNVSSVLESLNQATKLVAAKPTLKLKIKKEHGTLNSSFIESDLGEGDSSPNHNKSNEDESNITHHRKKRNKHKKKIYKIPKQLALIIKQEKQIRDDCDKDISTSVEDDANRDSIITVPVISEVTSIADTVLEAANINQSDYLEEDEDASLSICYPGKFREITEGVEELVEPQNKVQMPVIAEVVSLKETEPRLPLISSVTSLSQASGIRVKMEFSNFASPRSDSFEARTVPGRSRKEQDDMITGNYHMEYDTVENSDEHLENTNSEYIANESDIEEKPNLGELLIMSDINMKIQSSTENMLEEHLSKEGESSLLTNVVNSGMKLSENSYIDQSFESSANGMEQSDIVVAQGNQQVSDVNDLENLKMALGGNVLDNNETNDNLKNNTAAIGLVAPEVITATDEVVFAESPPEISYPSVNDQLVLENISCEEKVNDVHLEQELTSSMDNGKLIDSNNLDVELRKTEIHKEELIDDINAIQQAIDCNDSNFIKDIHKLVIEQQDYQNIEKNPVRTLIDDLVQSNKIVEKHNIQFQTADKPNLEGGCNKTYFQNMQIDHATRSGETENEPSELLIPSIIHVHTGATKRQLEIDVNSEESTHKIKKLTDIYFGKDVEFEAKPPLELNYNDSLDELNESTRTNSIINSEYMVSETEKDVVLHEVQVQLLCNTVPIEDKLEGDKNFVTSPTKDEIDAHSNQMNSNILDLQNENLNSTKTCNQIIRTDMSKDKPSDHDEESVNFIPKTETSTTLVEETELKNQTVGSVEVIPINIIGNNEEHEESIITKGLYSYSRLLSTNVEEHVNKKVEPMQDEIINTELKPQTDEPVEEHPVISINRIGNNEGNEEPVVTEGLNSILLSTNIEEHVNKEVEPIQDEIINTMVEGDSKIVSLDFDKHDEAQKEINVIEILDSSINMPIRSQGEGKSNLEDLFNIVSDSEGVQQDLQVDRKESRIKKTCYNLETSTNNIKVISEQFQNENVIIMESEKSRVRDEVLLHNADLSEESSDCRLVNDNFSKIHEETDSEMDQEQLTFHNVAVQPYRTVSSEAISVEVGYNSNKLKTECSVTVEDEESTMSEIIVEQSEANMEETISIKNENDNLLVQRQFNSSLNASYEGDEYLSDEITQPSLENELNEISDESCKTSVSRNISDALKERIRSQENLELDCENIEDHLIRTDILDEFNELKNPEEEGNETSPHSSREIKEISESIKQAEEIITSETSSDNLVVILEKSLPCIANSSSASSPNIKIECKNFEQTLSSPLKPPHTQVNETVEAINTAENLTVEINRNTIVLSCSGFQTIDNETVSEHIPRISSDVILEESIETTSQNIHSILERNIHSDSSNIVVQHIRSSSHENLKDNLDNQTDLGINILKINPIDGIIYKTDETEEDIDSDLEKELLEEMHDYEPDK